MNLKCYEELKSAYLRASRTKKAKYWDILDRLNKTYGRRTVDECAAYLRKELRGK